MTTDRKNPFRLVGGVDVAPESAKPVEQPDDGPDPRVYWRGRDDVRNAIRRHETARQDYARAAAWLGEAELAGTYPATVVESARLEAIRTFEEMNDCGRSLVLSMGTDIKGLIDLLMYMEKHFSVLPQEINGRSLAFFMLNTVRLSLRGIAKYGKSGPGQ